MATLYEYYNTFDDMDQNVVNEQWQAQTFTPELSHQLTLLKLKVAKTFGGSPESLATVGLRATDGDGKPTGGDLVAATFDVSALPTLPGEDPVWLEIPLISNLLAETKYAIVVRYLDPVPANQILVWRRDSLGEYARGEAWASADSGTTWTGPWGDMMFEEWGNPVAAREYKGNILIDQLKFQHCERVKV